jgi:transposase InsO family protein
VSGLRQHAERYLAMRRALGYKLVDFEHVLMQFITYLERTGASTVSIDAAVAWARQPGRSQARPMAPPAVGGQGVRPPPTHAGPGHRGAAGGAVALLPGPDPAASVLAGGAAVACRALGVSQSWFYKWWRRDGPAPRAARRAELDAAVASVFWRRRGTYGSPRITVELREAGWRVSENTVAASMRRQQLVATPRRRRRGTTRPGKGRWRAADHLKRDFTAARVNQRWCGDGTEIPTDQGRLYLYVVLDLFSRRVPGFAIDAHHNEPLARAALQTAVAVRGGHVAGVVFHSDQGSEYVAADFRAACARMGITQSMGRVGSALDNAAAESFNSTLEHELLSRTRFPTRAEARAAVAAWIDDYNHNRRHSSIAMMSPVDFERTEALPKETAA